MVVLYVCYECIEVKICQYKYINSNQHEKQKKNYYDTFFCYCSCLKTHNLISNYNKSI